MRRMHILWLMLMSMLLSLGWLYYRSPSYALWELGRAIQKKNLSVFYKRVEIEALQRSSIDAMTTKGLADSGKDHSLIEAASAGLGSGVSKILAMGSLDSLKHEVELEFQRDRSKSAPIDPRYPKSLLRSFLHDAEEYDVLDWVYAEDQVIIEGRVKLLKMAKDYPLRFRMRRNRTGDWQISSFEGLSSQLALYEQDRLQRLRAHNEGIQSELRSSLPFFGETRSESSGIGSVIYLDILFQNKFSSNVTYISGDIRGPGSNSELDAKFISDSSVILPKEKRVFLVRKEKYFAPIDAKFQGVSLVFLYDEVRLEGGRILKVASDFDEISH